MISEDLRHLHDALGSLGEGAVVLSQSLMQSLRARIGEAAEQVAEMEARIVPAQARADGVYPPNVVALRPRPQTTHQTSNGDPAA